MKSLTLRKTLGALFAMYVMTVGSLIAVADSQVGGVVSPAATLATQVGVWGTPYPVSHTPVGSGTTLATAAGPDYNSTTQLMGPCAVGVSHGLYQVIWGDGPINLRRGTLYRYLQICH